MVSSSESPASPIPPASPTRIALIHAHALERRGIELLIESQHDWRVDFSGDSLRELLHYGPAVDAVVLDLDIGHDGFKATDVLAQLRMRVSIVAISDLRNMQAVRQVLHLGVRALVSKDDTDLDLLEAIDYALARQAWMTPQVSMALAADAAEKLHLSDQERNVLARYAAGQKAAAVARSLGISVHTVRDHLKSIRRKLADAGTPAPTQTDLYKQAVDLGLIQR